MKTLVVNKMVKAWKRKQYCKRHLTVGRLPGVAGRKVGFVVISSGVSLALSQMWDLGKSCNPGHKFLQLKNGHSGQGTWAQQ